MSWAVECDGRRYQSLQESGYWDLSNTAVEFHVYFVERPIRFNNRFGLIWGLKSVVKSRINVISAITYLQVLCSRGPGPLGILQPPIVHPCTSLPQEATPSVDFLHLS